MKAWTSVVVVLLAFSVVALAEQGMEEPKMAEMKMEATSTNVTMTDVTPLTDLMTSPEQYLGKTVLIEGKVTGRCAHSGCWVSLDTGDPENRLIVRTEDESFVFPAECVDKDIQVQGTLMLKKVEKEEGEMEEGEDHECPNPEYFFKPDAMKIKA